MDEATSGLDEATQAVCMSLCRDSGITTLSVGHRSSLIPFHDQVIVLRADDQHVSLPPADAVRAISITSAGELTLKPVPVVAPSTQSTVAAAAAAAVAVAAAAAPTISLCPPLEVTSTTWSSLPPPLAPSRLSTVASPPAAAVTAVSSLSASSLRPGPATVVVLPEPEPQRTSTRFDAVFVRRFWMLFQLGFPALVSVFAKSTRLLYRWIPLALLSYSLPALLVVMIAALYMLANTCWFPLPRVTVRSVGFSLLPLRGSLWFPGVGQHAAHAVHRWPQRLHGVHHCVRGVRPWPRLRCT